MANDIIVRIAIDGKPATCRTPGSKSDSAEQND